MWFLKMYFPSPSRPSFAKFYENVLFGKRVHTTSGLTAGHSKWANIRHVKTLKDGQKSQLFEKMSRQIRLAIREGRSADPSLNSMLRSAVDDALRKSMPMATIRNSINVSHPIVYTSNFAQMKSELAPILKKSGAVHIKGQHMFDNVGMIEAVAGDEIISKAKSSCELEDICTEDAIECGVEDVQVIKDTNGTVNFICNPIGLDIISRALKAKGYVCKSLKYVFIPKNRVTLTKEELLRYQSFLKKLRNVPCVEEIYDNLAEHPD